MLGLMLVWSKGAPQDRVWSLPLDEKFLITRSLVPDDDRTSAQHATIYARADDFIVSNKGALNGTYVDGEEVQGTANAWTGSVIRTGSSLWVVCADITDTDGLREQVQAIRFATAMPIHYSLVAACLAATWATREALVLAVAAAAEAAIARGSDRVAVEDLGPVAARNPPQSFAKHFTHVMGSKPPFTIPTTYVVHGTTRVKGVPHESLISSDKIAPNLDQADLRSALVKKPGYFMAGFRKGAVYLAETHERSQLFLRLSYADAAAQHVALRRMERCTFLASTLPVARVTLLDSLGTAYYEIIRHDGQVVSCPPGLASLDDVDFLALAM